MFISLLARNILGIIAALLFVTFPTIYGQGSTACDFSKPGSSLSKWYPDSKSLVYFFSDENPTINKIDIEGVHNEIIITGNDGIGHPSVTDENSILYQRNHPLTGKKVIVLRSNDHKEIILTDSMFNSTDGAHHPNDTKVAFAKENEEGNLDIYSLNYQTRKVRRLTFSKSYDYSPHWSPDGTQLIFTSHREGQPKIYRMDSDGSNILKLTPGTKEEFSAAWSPDGSSIVFSSRNAESLDGQDPMIKHNSSDLFILTLRTNEVTRITDNEDMEVLPDWSPNGNYITYTSCATGNREIYVLDINSGETKRLTFAE